jgi:hypothetical protein
MPDAAQQQLTKLRMKAIAPRPNVLDPLRGRAIDGAIRCLFVAPAASES